MSKDAADAEHEVMEQAQVFASAWSLIGGPFDSGNMLAEAEEAKEELRRMVRTLTLLAAQAVGSGPHG